ncbi:hypothetical protein ACJIZ3_000786 [Penstemon smallii]|uniref:Amidase domain-containing protein n=1 Tax=Penstemon smallii TaxID=265156 RepID=A0ABD3U447_9LAMI
MQNPYVSSGAGGTPCGSSSGSAISVAANMVSVALGTETQIKLHYLPFISDAVYVLDVIAGFDPRDEATSEGAKFIPRGGKRLGIVRHPFVEKIHGTAELEAFELHVDSLRQQGAKVLDNMKIENIDIILEPNHSGEISVIMADFKTSINIYLKELLDSPVRSLKDVIAFNECNAELRRRHKLDAIVSKLDSLCLNGLEKLMKEHKLDAIVTPGSRACAVFAIGGYPAITVPAGYERDGMPFGICFGGLKGAEPKLIEISYAFEQATQVRKPPPLNHT